MSNGENGANLSWNGNRPIIIALGGTWVAILGLGGWLISQSVSVGQYKEKVDHNGERITRIEIYGSPDLADRREEVNRRLEQLERHAERTDDAIMKLQDH
jgi:hypothetical protein